MLPDFTPFVEPVIMRHGPDDGDNKPSDDNDGPPGSRVPKRPLPKSPDVGMQKALANDKTNQ